MKNKNRIFLKAGVTVFIVIFFLLTSIPVNASTPDISSMISYVVNDNSNEPLDDGFWRDVPSSGLIYVGFPLFVKILGGGGYYPISIADWSSKPFHRPTIMWIGSGIGLLPGLPVFMLLRIEDHGFIKIDLYSDGEFYTTLTGINFLVPVVYNQKGFHHLKFVPEGFESETLEIDVQIGFNGFVENILPYLT